MAATVATWQKYQHNLTKVLTFLNNDGDFNKASTLLNKALACPLT